MSLTLREATLDDVERFCDVNMSAYNNEPVILETFPPESDSSREFLRQLTIMNINSPHSHVLVVTDEEDSGRIISIARWKPPGLPIEDPPPAHVFPPDGNPELAARFFKQLAQGHREVMQDRDHWTLELVATAEKARGRGAAGKLVQWGLDKADADGLPVYLEATDMGEPMYAKRFRFQVVRRDVIDIGSKTVEVPFMVRQPQNPR